MATARKRAREIEQGDEWMSLGAAARALKQQRLTVLTRIVKGELIGEHRAGMTFVRRESVERALAAQRGR